MPYFLQSELYGPINKWEWEGEREKSQRRNVQLPAKRSGPATGEECRLNVMVQVAFRFMFSGKRDYQVEHKLLVSCIKRARKLLPVTIFSQISDCGKSIWQVFTAGICHSICLKETKYLFFIGR